MPDDLSRREPEDPKRINQNQEWELRYWSGRLNVTIEELLRAIEEVGPMVTDVREYLGV